jgi:uncharacterized protein (TIGR03067 family)
MTRRLTLALTVVFLLGAGQLKDEAVPKEVQQLEGTWAVTSLTLNGQDVAKVADFNLKMILKGNQFTVKAGDKVLGQGTFEIDPNQKPKTMEQTATTGENKGKTSLGIYEVTGDTLKTCFNAAGKTSRPTTFESKAGTEHELAVYKREKR